MTNLYRRCRTWARDAAIIHWLVIVMLLGFTVLDVHVWRTYSGATAWLMVLVFCWGIATCCLFWFEFFDVKQRESDKIAMMELYDDEVVEVVRDRGSSL